MKSHPSLVTAPELEIWTMNDQDLYTSQNPIPVFKQLSYWNDGIKTFMEDMWHLLTCIPGGFWIRPSRGQSLSFCSRWLQEWVSWTADSCLRCISSWLSEYELSTFLFPHNYGLSRVIIFFNIQEEVVKLTEKCLNNAIESPGLNAVRVPPDFKSNILKAQVEAVHKVSFL